MQDETYVVVPDSLPGLQGTLLRFVSACPHLYAQKDLPPIPDAWFQDATCPPDAIRINCLGVMPNGDVAFRVTRKQPPSYNANVPIQEVLSFRFFISQQGDMLWHQGYERMMGEVLGGVPCYCCGESMHCQPLKSDSPVFDVSFVQLPCCDNFVDLSCFKTTQQVVQNICPCCERPIDWQIFNTINHHTSDEFCQAGEAEGVLSDHPSERLLSDSRSLLLRNWFDQVLGLTSQKLRRLSVPMLWLLIFRTNQLTAFRHSLDTVQTHSWLNKVRTPKHLIVKGLKQLCQLSPPELALCLTGNLCYLVQHEKAGKKSKDKAKFLERFLRQYPKLLTLLSHPQSYQCLSAALDAGQLDVLNQLSPDSLTYLKTHSGAYVWSVFMNQLSHGKSADFLDIHRQLCVKYQQSEAPAADSAGRSDEARPKDAAASANAALSTADDNPEDEPLYWRDPRTPEQKIADRAKRESTLNRKRGRSCGESVASPAGDFSAHGRLRRHTEPVEPVLHSLLRARHQAMIAFNQTKDEPDSIPAAQMAGFSAEKSESNGRASNSTLSHNSEEEGEDGAYIISSV